MTQKQLTLSFSFGLECEFKHFWPEGNAQVVHRLKTIAAGVSADYLYLWGREHSGKSHLLQACCHEADQRRVRAAFIPLEEFKSFGPAILEGLDQCKIICLDDLHCVTGDPVWEEALFALFNQIKDERRSLIISCDVSPQSVQIQLRDLLSRVRSGETYHLEELTDEGKEQALILRAQARGMKLPQEVSHYIISRGSRRLFDLMEILNQVDRSSLEAKRPLTIPFVKQVLGW